MRDLILRSATLCLALIIAGAAWPQSPQITVLTGTVVHCDSSDSGGHPEAIHWVATPPGGIPPTKPTSTEPAFDLMVDIPGTWTIDLYLSFAHDVDGSPWSSQDQGLIEAKSVVADLDPGPPVVTTTDTITLDGSGSQISDLAVASAVFKVDDTPIDGCDFPGPITDPAELFCTVEASDLGPGTFVVSLNLTDSVGGFTDRAQATIEIIEEPPFTVDFNWIPSGSDPLTLLVDLVLSEGWTFSDLENAEWDFDDGSPPETVECSSSNFYCQYWSHQYSTDGYYDISVTVTTDGGHWDSVTNLVTVGDPPPLPTADFTASPAAATVNSAVSFTFTGSCTDVCTYLWDFGDGSTSSQLNPTHVFIEPIDRNVGLTVTNDSGQDTENRLITVSDCWFPFGTISQEGSCYGAPVSLTAPTADAFSWSTGSHSNPVTVAQPTTYWVHLLQGVDCWAYREHTVTLEQCSGTPEGNTDMDGEGRVDAADLQALIRELSDGDGPLVIDSWAAELGAPGSDLTGMIGPDPDGMITGDDVDRLLEILFSDE